MNVRVIAVAAAAVLAAGCKTSGSQSRGGTAQASPPSDAQGGAAGQAGHDPLVEPGPEIKAHASDQIVSGQIGEVSPSSVTVETDLGDMKVLEIAAETEITVAGHDATAAELQEGQQVRASFNEVDGREVAVKLEVDSASPLESMGSPPASEPGTSAIPEPGSPSDVTPRDSTGTGSAADGPEPAGEPPESGTPPRG
jgi:Cu/Ag efflux protein CusF